MKTSMLTQRFKIILFLKCIIQKKINRDKYDKKIEQNFFNYNNFNMTDTYDSGEVLLLPTLIYDASRYNISYTKQIYGVTNTITSSFKILGDTGQVTFYLNGATAPFKADYVNKTTVGGVDYFIYDGLNINDVADYNFTVKYTYRVSDTNFVIATTGSIYEPSTRGNNVLLSVFGYQSYYSKK